VPEGEAAGGTTRSRRLARGILALLCLLQLLPLLGGYGPAARDPRPDTYYLRKSEALVRTGSFERPAPEDLAVLRGEAMGQSDFRPPGYPVFLALLGVTGENWEGRDRWIAVVQVAAAAACLWWILERALERLSAREGVLAAVLLGAQPWAFEFAYDRLPDTLTMAAAFAGADLAAGAATAASPARRAALAATSGAALGVSTFLRPEMLAFAPLVLAAGLLLLARSAGVRAAALPALAGGLVLLAAFGGHVAYRRAVFGEWAVVGRFQGNAPGVARWLKTWTSNDTDLRRIRAPLAQGERIRFDRIPDRAFADAAEREEVRLLVGEIARRGEYLAEHDAAFARIAERRARADPVGSVVVPRLWCTAALLLTPGSAATLHPTRLLPDRAERAFAWLFVGIRFAVLAAAAIAMARALRRPPGAGADAVAAAVFLGAVLCVARLAWLGLGRGILEYRYALLLWPFLLLAAIAWADQRRRRRSLGTRDLSAAGAA
jgi:hypothetical protein